MKERIVKKRQLSQKFFNRDCFIVFSELHHIINNICKENNYTLGRRPSIPQFFASWSLGTKAFCMIGIAINFLRYSQQASNEWPKLQVSSLFSPDDGASNQQISRGNSTHHPPCLLTLISVSSWTISVAVYLVFVRHWKRAFHGLDFGPHLLSVYSHCLGESHPVREIHIWLQCSRVWERFSSPDNRKGKKKKDKLKLQVFKIKLQKNVDSNSRGTWNHHRWAKGHKILFLETSAGTKAMNLSQWEVLE